MKTDPSFARACTILRMYVNEERSLQEIGDKFGITRERVRQILLKDFGIRGLSELAKRREAKEAVIKTRRERDTLATKGVSLSELKELRALGVTAAYTAKRNNVIRYHKGHWGLTLAEFWSIWRDSGRFADRGRGASKFGMTTIDGSANFVVGNVEIVPAIEAPRRAMVAYWASEPVRPTYARQNGKPPREKNPPREKSVVAPRIPPEFPQVSSRAELRKTICELKGKATAREIMNAYGLQSRNVVIGIWGRARRSSNGAAA